MINNTIYTLERLVLEINREFTENVKLTIGGGYMFDRDIFSQIESVEFIGRRFVESIVRR